MDQDYITLDISHSVEMAEAVMSEIEENDQIQREYNQMMDDSILELRDTLNGLRDQYRRDSRQTAILALIAAISGVVSACIGVISLFASC